MSHTELATWLLLLVAIFVGSAIVTELRAIVQQLKEVAFKVERIDDHTEEILRTLLSLPDGGSTRR